MTPREKSLRDNLQSQIGKALQITLPSMLSELLGYYDEDGQDHITNVVFSHADVIADVLATAIYNAISQSIRGIKFEGCLGLTTIGSPTTQYSNPMLPNNKISGKFFTLKSPQYLGLPVTPNFIKIDVE